MDSLPKIVSCDLDQLGMKRAAMVPFADFHMDSGYKAIRITTDNTLTHIIIIIEYLGFLVKY